jgi:S-DNA-T family DNA segregation ATPase FtsK/SpoIIIE
MGPFGRSVAKLTYAVCGVCAYLVAVGLGALATRLLLNARPLARIRHLLGAGLGIVAIGTLAHLTFASYRVAGYSPGGLLGENVAEVFRAVVSTAGTALLACVGLLVAVIIATPLRMRTVVNTVASSGRFLGLGAFRGIRRAGADASRFSGEVIRAVLPERDHDEYLDHEDDFGEASMSGEIAADPAFMGPPIIDARAPSADLDIGDTIRDEPAVIIGEVAEEAIELTKKKTKSKKKRKKRNTMPGLGEDGLPPAKVAVVAADEDAEEEDILEDEEEVETAKAKKNSKKKKKVKEPELAAPEEEVEEEESKREPVIVESQFRGKDSSEMAKQEKQLDAERLDFIPLGDGDYKLPPVNLLNFDDTKESSIDRTAMLELSAKLAQTLENYGVKGEVTAIRPGPVVTMYEFAPSPGTRISKIVGLSDDLAMSLEALRVRIVAPIPGKAAVGIEVPNPSKEMVYLKEIIADDTFQKSGMKLPMALGKNIEGAPTVVDLAKMPHLLVAGTTGSGKSVSVNTMIASLLYNSTPEDVRMIMVDPKMLELSIYEGVPHLLLPVVTDPKKANLALRWAVEEMERRYELLANMGVRDIGGYNKKLIKVQAQFKAEQLERAAEEARRMAEDGEFEVEITEEREMPVAEAPRKLPYIVVIIDEFADLMMCAPKEVETSVARIAQKARAAGIHLVLATQRPSVDVITGLIKANFPSRLAFRVTSKVDSRTILDQGGAENLLGAGDMLFSDRGSSPVRLHGCFVDEEEIASVVDFLKSQGRPVYNMEILKPRDEEGMDSEDDQPIDVMYDKAIAIVAETQRVSVSFLQRRLSVGYNRAAKMVERMERDGIVSAPDNKKVREVLVSSAA